MSKTKQEKKVLSPNEIKTIIIVAICVVMAIILAVSLPLLLKKEAETPSTSTPSTGSSQLTIKNGDFAYFDKEGATFPKTADNWSQATYKEPDGSTHKFDAITTTDNVIMGVVDVEAEKWTQVASDLNSAGIANVSNPGKYDDELLDTNVYMFATKQATTASIISSGSFSIASQASAKITVRLNTAQMTSGNAVVMIQKYASFNNLTADEKDSSDNQNWFAHDFNIAQKDGWQELTFFLFNRETGSRSLVISIGIGNCYNGATAEGVLFVDDIEYETVSANEYRKYVADSENTDTTYAIIGEDKVFNTTDYNQLVNYFDGLENAPLTLAQYEAMADAKEENEVYSPFTIHDAFLIHKITSENAPTDSDGKILPIGLMLNAWNGNPIVVQSSEELKDHLHISFWLRVVQNNVTAQANIYLQQQDDAEWTDLPNGSFTSIVTEQDIATDKNCGWSKYDVYVKPKTGSGNSTTVRLVIALGNIKGYDNQTKYTPDGSIYVTTPYVENVSSSDYSSASSGTYSKKVSLIGNTASTSVTNGSFSNLSTSTPSQPTSWIPVFAGANVIYKDGKGNSSIEGLPTASTDVSAQLVKGDSTNGPKFDDSEHNYLKITNYAATSFGYLSSDITLTSKTVYSFSVLAKVDAGANPYFYVIKNNAESRSQAIVASVTSAAATTSDSVDNSLGMIGNSEQGNGWVRYYIVIVTGDKAETVRVALFNGGIDGTAESRQGSATGVSVCYDSVCMNNLGTYTVNTQEDEGDTVTAARERIEFTAASGYETFDKLTDEEIATLSENENVVVSTPDFASIVENAMKKDDSSNNEPTTPTKTPVDLALLFSVISSVALVGALLIVVVVRIFKKRSK